MTQSHGRDFEHSLADELSEVTPPEVWCTTCGFSGNSGYDSCDIVVTVDPKLRLRDDPPQYNIEAKKRQGDGGNRVITFSGGSDSETGVEELQRFVEDTPNWATPRVAIKFDHRRLSVIDPRDVLSAVGELKWPLGEHREIHDARQTESGSISMRKPTLDDWESSQAAPSDGVVLATELGLPVIDDD